METMGPRSTPPQVRNAREEAARATGKDVGVLEPSPPTVSEEPFFADDPVAGEPGFSWATWVGADSDRGDWAATRWVAGPRRLPATPDAGTLITTRRSLHRLAAYVIAPVRHAANGKFGLRWTLGGFGTPFFGADRQIRVEDDTLIDQLGDTVRSAPITSLAAAAEFLETTIDPETAAEHDSPRVGDVAEPLAIDAAAASFLGNWYGMGFAALEVLRADPASIDPSRPQLWPGHFDPAIEEGDEDHRTSYGASPGDDGIAEPYLYAGVWWADRLGLDGDDRDPVEWNAPTFVGRILKLADFPSDADPVDVAVDFFTSARDAIASQPV